MKDTIQSSGLKVRVEGPAPTMHEKSNGSYNWQLVVKSRDRRELLRVLPLLAGSNGWTYDLDPVNLL
jgi:primosomal protein N'